MRWHGWHKEREEFKAHQGVKVSIENDGAMVEAPDVFVLHRLGTTGLADKNNGLMTGQNSGYQAINLAYLLGAARIVLLGFDMKRGADGRAHWFGDHPVQTQDYIYSAMLQNFPKLARRLKELGIEVINCTPDSALDAFPRNELARVLPHP